MKSDENLHGTNSGLIAALLTVLPLAGKSANPSRANSRRRQSASAHYTSLNATTINTV